MFLISIMTRSSSHLVREMDQNSGSIKTKNEQLQHNGNFTEATAAEINHNLVCTFIEVSVGYRFCYKPNITVLKSCIMLSRSSIMVLCFGRDLFPRVSLHEDWHTHSTHCMQIILKTRFQFPHWVMKKCFASKGYPNIQTYLPFLV